MSVITRIKNIANKNYCPLDNTSGPIEWLQFKNWAKRNPPWKFLAVA